MTTDPWGNDPDRTTRRETPPAWQDEALAVANNRPLRVEVVTPKPDRTSKVLAFLCALLVLAGVAGFVWATAFYDPTPPAHPVEPAVWFEPTPETVEVTLWAT